MTTLEELAPILSGLERAAQSLLIQLCVRAKEGTVTASYSNLRQWTGIKAIKTIHAGTAELAAKGFLRIRPGQPGLTSIYEITLPGREVIPTPTSTSERVIELSPGNKLLLGAIKKSLSPAAWNIIKREAAISGESEDKIIISRYFGPSRLNG